MKLFAVGDEDQTIYTFRGSHGEFIDNYVSDFNARLIPLGSSYRCSDGILFAAGSLIQRNRRSYQQPPSPPGNIKEKPPLGVFEVEDEEEEARIVAKVIRSWVEAGSDYRGIAVLYRVHNLADECERVLIESGVPVVRLSPERQRRELPADPLPFLRLAVSDSEWDWDRALGLPRDRLGELDDLRLRLAAVKEGVALDKLIARASKFRHLSALGQSQIRRLSDFVKALKKTAAKEAPSMLLNRTVEHLMSTGSPWRPHEDLWLKVEEDCLQGFDRIAPDALLEEWTKSENGIRIIHAPTVTALIAAKLIESGCDRIIGVKTERIAARGTTDGLNDIPIDSRPAVVIGLNLKPDMLFPAEVLLPRALYIAPDGVSETPPAESCTDEAFPLALAAHRLIAQLVGYRPGGAPGEDLVFFDIETTGTDIFRSEIVEIAAIRVHLKGNEARELGHFHSLVKPSRPIPAAATEVHGITDEDVRDSPSLKDVLPRFLDFIGDSPLAGHNIETFDLPIIRRHASNILRRVVGNLTLDTLPFSKRLFPGEPHRLGALAEKLDIPVEQAHRALDDVRTNIGVFNRLIEIDEGSRARGFAPDVPLALALAHSLDLLTDTDPSFLRSAANRYLVRFTPDPEKHPLVRELIDSVSPAVQNRIRSSVRSIMRREHSPDEFESELEERIQFLRSEALRLEDDNPNISLVEYLSHIAMLTDGDFDSDDDAVRMMTLHAAKGLEFDRVIIIGMEQGHLPHYLATNKTVAEIEEERRLAYVGITRAQDKAALFYARRRFGRWRPRSMFIGELPASSIRKYKTRDRMGET
jgi:DNA polymerase III epsilon subunit family exonuclease